MTTTRRELGPRYDAAAVEPAIYERWLAADAFRPADEAPPGSEPFVIIQPPPNVTGALHLGHALTAFVEDILVRYHRMKGDDTLWLPGVDHASIAAQFVLDRTLAEEGESRQSLGRERYLERMWQFMEETRGTIGEQHRRLGTSLDWSRLRFTMDEGSARAVRVAFKRLWDAGLAYRGEALVNWCPRCRTTISDLENIKREETGTLWSIRYHLADASGAPDRDAWITVATTRPETLFGDTAVAVHPEDDRYRDLVGRDAILPFLGRRLPIVADEHVDPAFGTGAVKITPAHDFDDYEVGQRHGLPMITVLDEDARLNDEAGEFAGLDRFEARPRIVEALREIGDLEGEGPHEMVIGRCDRCGTVVEPRLSVQWFVNVKPLAERALASVREGRTRIIPAHYEKVYAHWMENIHDWAVGRQLWWGHRIPAWYCPDGHITVSDDEGGPDACAECGRPSAELTQDMDIFDTWFSSGLGPFSTLGWPDDTPDLRRFYPTQVME
ncbi:MAG: valine--tRNA ligase, partial [Chloroflexota bacterium]|nr:valine--tRNA ligase [Chloroflexota bacterium]